MATKEPDQRGTDQVEQDENCSPAVGYQPGRQKKSSEAQQAQRKAKDGGEEHASTRMKGSHPGDRYVRVVRQAAPPPVAAPKPKFVPKPKSRRAGPFRRWLLQGEVRAVDAPYERDPERRPAIHVG